MSVCVFHSSTSATIKCNFASSQGHQYNTSRARARPHTHTNLSNHKGEILSLYLCIRQTRWRRCFKHCATRQELANSIPDQVVGIFVNVILLAALWCRKEYQEYFPVRKSGLCVWLTKTPLSCTDCPGTRSVCSGLYSNRFTFCYLFIHLPNVQVKVFLLWSW